MPAEASFQLYRLLIEEVREARRARRELSNAFLSLNLAGVGALGFLTKDGGGDFPGALLFWCAIALVFTCWIWRTSNKYYTQMLKAKYDVLYEVENGLEQELGAKPLQTEWKMLKPTKPNRTFFSLEYAMPALFIIGYVLFLAYQVSWQELVAIAEAAWAPIAGLLPS